MNVVITGEEFNETLSFFLRLRLIYAFEKKKKKIFEKTDTNIVEISFLN